MLLSNFVSFRNWTDINIKTGSTTSATQSAFMAADPSQKTRMLYTIRIILLSPARHLQEILKLNLNWNAQMVLWWIWHSTYTSNTQEVLQ